MKFSKRALIDNSLFLYSGIVAFGLTGVALFNLKSPNSALTLVLFLPVFFYFLLKIIQTTINQVQQFLNSGSSPQPYFGHFSFYAFFDQPDLSFSLNMFLIALATCLVLFKISTMIIE